MIQSIPDQFQNQVPPYIYLFFVQEAISLGHSLHQQREERTSFMSTLINDNDKSVASMNTFFYEDSYLGK